MSRVQLLSKNNTAASVNNDGVKSRLPQKKQGKHHCGYILSAEIS